MTKLRSKVLIAILSAFLVFGSAACTTETGGESVTQQ